MTSPSPSPSDTFLTSSPSPSHPPSRFHKRNKSIAVPISHSFAKFTSDSTSHPSPSPSPSPFPKFSSSSSASQNSHSIQSNYNQNINNVKKSSSSSSSLSSSSSSSSPSFPLSPPHRSPASPLPLTPNSSSQSNSHSHTKNYNNFTQNQTANYKSNSSPNYSRTLSSPLSHQSQTHSPMSPSSPLPLTIPAYPSSSKNFKVIIRVRPPTPSEIESEGGPSRYKDIIRVHSPPVSLTIVEPTIGMYQFDIGMINNQTFTFDNIYDQQSRQSDIYEGNIKEGVRAVLEGYNATVFAYGQTGSGKTFTMEGIGSSDLSGLIPRCVSDIFRHINLTASPRCHYLVRASFLQIYNEMISDLLKSDRHNLSIREDKKRGIYVDGMSEWVVRSPMEVFSLIQRGQMSRNTAATKMNETSSRSHAIFQIIIESAEIEVTPSSIPSAPPTQTTKYKISKLNLVDLAGSERVRITGAKGNRLEESKYINQSLSALGNVISALVDGRRHHIPVRDSKLTRLLHDSLGGNCKTYMLAMISPVGDSFLETISTLKFANRAKRIQNSAKINEDIDEKTLLRKYEKELKHLRSELKERNDLAFEKNKMLEIEGEMHKISMGKSEAEERVETLRRELSEEKELKGILEQKIQQMSDQIINQTEGIISMQNINNGGNPIDLDSIRSLYEQKYAELSSSASISSHKYREILIKQRDVMLLLTGRLSERDERIIQLEEELEEKEKEMYQMEGEMDHFRLIIMQYEKRIIDLEGKAKGQQKGNGKGNSRDDGDWEGDNEVGDGEFPLDNRHSSLSSSLPSITFNPFSPSSSPSSSSSSLSLSSLQQSYEEKIRILLNEIQRLNGNGNVEGEEEGNGNGKGQTPRRSNDSDSDSSSSLLSSLRSTIRQQESLLSTLQSQNSSLHSQHQLTADHMRIQEEKMSEMSFSLQKSFDEKRAMEIILREKIKVLIDNIANGVEQKQDERTKKYLLVLKRVVEASIKAMAN